MRVMNKYNTHKHVLFNKRINDNLEQQAQALFDYYFSADSKYLSDSEQGVLTNIAVYLWKSGKNTN